MTHRKSAVALFLLGLVARLIVVAWARSDFPATADGFFYDTLARRLAEGNGYTWLWGDGTVTYAAHYPVGYPALLALPYVLFGAHPVVAGVINAFVGALAGVGAHGLLGGRRGVIAGGIVALHPALVLYTPAIMTEGIATALLVSGAAIASSTKLDPRARLGLAAFVLGLATLVRPQILMLAPFLALLVWDGWKARLAGGVAALLIVTAVCLPWTARNCVRMHRCALVSVNAGWNLLIGTQTENGGWQEVDVPAECRTVWDEAAKDACFERAAKNTIARTPIGWVARVPAKLRTTFDYFGAGPWYLHAANPARFSDSAKVAWGIVETIVSRGLLIGALASRAWFERRRYWIAGVAGVGALLGGTEHWSWLAYLILGAVVLPRGKPAEVFSALVIIATAIVHAIFFGAGRYGLLIVPFVAILAASGERPVTRPGGMPV